MTTYIVLHIHSKNMYTDVLYLFKIASKHGAHAKITLLHGEGGVSGADIALLLHIILGVNAIHRYARASILVSIY